MSNLLQTPAPAKNDNTAQPAPQQSQTEPAQSTQSFANCTQLRAVYPNGVPQGHPAYQPKLDRDNDNFACER
ncbi:excalibur calcium-binding domain-containing protein [Staphylococcus coagulans]|uniref:excalibur calcium-binding domain-containing protein n=1 Tax=Staphylococcus coagulans TaxID=74706 RepID=UPI001FD9A7B4|nr:excalibur calcium-binding domain-containing protein [Staphylococcus coagulans]